MKYMGSKKAMLKNGLGELLLEQANVCNRFFDPFSGSAAVTRFVAENTDKEVIAGDLQKYAIDLANSILLRTKPLDSQELSLINKWLKDSEGNFSKQKSSLQLKETKKCVKENRDVSKISDVNLIKAYGGFYFSFDQALCFSQLISALPQNDSLKSFAIACILESASKCVAAPGHTAQPFQPTDTGLSFLIESWKKDPIVHVRNAVSILKDRFAKTKGNATVSDVTSLLTNLTEGDLVFLDPPYSGVHYSRFYHVYETISRGTNITVSGKGRYPAYSERPQSELSLRSKSQSSFESILKTISQSKAKAILTFPAGSCSNGLSGEVVKEVSKKYFSVKKEIIKGKFSTLGGNNENRPARHVSSELVLLLEPK